MTIKIRGNLHTIDSPAVVGIINYTDDSFFEGSRCCNLASVLRQAEKHIDEGADWIDLGCASSRPGAIDTDVHSELTRAVEAVSALRKRHPDIPISIDTWQAKVAKAAVEAGADIVNDISGGTFDNEMLDTVAELQCPYILTHTPAKPDSMQQHTDYHHLLSEIFQFFGRQIKAATRAGIHDIILDPGFGFGKTVKQNFEILRNLSYYRQLGYPILVGISRKSMIYKSLKINPEQSLNGTTAVHAWALQNGANLLRVHDVKEAKEAATLFSLLNVPNKSTDSL